MKRWLYPLLCVIAYTLVSAGCPPQTPTSHTKILFISDRTGNRDVHIAALDGSNVLNISNDTADNWDAVVSPDHSFIVYDAAPDSDHSAVRRANLNGTSVATLVDATQNNGPIGFTTDGSYVLVYTRANNSYSLQRVNPNGTALTPLVTHPKQVAGVSVRPQTYQVAYTVRTWLNPDDFISDLYCLDMQTSANQKFSIPATMQDWVRYSPDGSHLAFCGSSNFDHGVYVMSPDGQNVFNVTDGAVAYYTSPAFSPDSQRLAYLHGTINAMSLAVVNLDGSKRKDLLAHAYAFTQPVWSPDGSRIACLADEGIWVAEADGSGSANLTHSTDTDSSPLWTPDGQQIVFESTRDGNSEIYIVNADGTGLTNLTNNPAEDRLSAVFDAN